MENNDGRKRVKTAAHIGDDYYALCYYSSKDQFLSFRRSELLLAALRLSLRSCAGGEACSSVRERQRRDRQRAVSSRAAGQTVYRQVGNYSTQ
ncbi:unnamed protein product [Sphagnum jensenii]|uniref:Uncharacterized protein n=1 Tax=Sphagnum jensenii TaxID=128206 RepID=A0ABP0VVM9_9BRYO